jgi:adenylate kinase
MLAGLGQKLELCVAISVEEEPLIQRLLKRAEIEGRADDNEETIRNRMRVYRDQTEPLLDYYRGKGILAEVEGSGTVEDVAERIGKVLE